MRQVVLYTLTALDGAVDEPNRYFLPTDGGPPVFDAVMDEHEARIVAAQDAVVLGRRMYDEWSRYWPGVVGHPFADFINGVQKYVVTSTPLANRWEPCEAVGTSVAELVAQLRERPGRDIGVHGSIELARSLLDAGLVDLLHLVVGPAYGFPGRRLFDAADVRRLELLEARSTPSGSLLLTYRPR